MVFELQDTSKAEHLFDGWQETLIWSCLQKVMGKVYVTDLEDPKSAFAFVGCFGFYAGEPDRELVEAKPAGFVIMTPQNEAWAKLIKTVYPDARKGNTICHQKGYKVRCRRFKGKSAKAS